MKLCIILLPNFNQNDANAVISQQKMTISQNTGMEGGRRKTVFILLWHARFYLKL